MRTTARRTQKQRIVMGIIMAAMDEGRDICVEEIHKALPYQCSYGALRITLRFLRKWDLVYYEKVGGRHFYKPTVKGLAWFRSGG